FPLILLSSLVTFGCSQRLPPPATEAKPASADTPEDRALAHLVREVPRWLVENKCRSCHNNGDGARVLYAARRLGYSIPDDARASTTAWLKQPNRWDKIGGETEYKDEGLARIQFATALVEATNAGVISSRRPLRDAAALVRKGQDGDGAWLSHFPGDIGS